MRCGQSKDFTFDIQISSTQNEGGNAGALLSQPLGQNGVWAKIRSPELIVSFSPSRVHLSPQLQNHPVNCPGKAFRLKTDVMGGFFSASPFAWFGSGHNCKNSSSRKMAEVVRNRGCM